MPDIGPNNGTEHHMTRKGINLTLASALIVAGFIGSIYVLFFSAAILLTEAGISQVVLSVGFIWLYFDLIEATPDDQQL